jgi:cytoskeletal protein RodZ
MTRLFGQRKDKTTIAELEEYYANQDQKKTKTGRAWFMALLSILLAVAIVLALFFAGRWLYRAITDDSSDNSATTSENTNSGEQVDLPTFDGDVVGQGNQPSENTGSSDSGSTSGSSNSSNTEENAGVVSDEAASTSESNADRVAGINNAGGTGGEPIPNTGAGDLLIVIPFVTAVAGYYISRKHYSKQK